MLTGNGITRYGDGLYSLIGAEELRDSERDALLQLCRQRLDGFREQRGEEVFAHRSRHRSPISGSVKYLVLTKARAAASDGSRTRLFLRNRRTPLRGLQASQFGNVSTSGP